MGLPSQKRTPSSKKRRASHFAIKPLSTVACAECGARTLPHRACSACGYYKGRKAVRIKEKSKKKKEKKN